MELVDVRPVWSMSDSEKLAALDALHDESARRDTYRLQLLASLEQTGYARELGAPDLATLLATRHRLNPTQVRADLKVATTLPKYPSVSAALPTPFDPPDDDIAVAIQDPAAPDTAPAQSPVWLHIGQAKAIIATLDKAPATVPVDDLAVAEEQMIEAARELNPLQLHQLGKKVLAVLDTDGPEPAEDKAYDREALQLKKTDHGVKFHGYLANENAELLNAVIIDNAKPHKTIDGQPDPRSKAKRQADALTTALTVAANTGETGNSAVKPHIAVTIDYDALTGALQKLAGHDETDTSSEAESLPGMDSLGGLSGSGGLGRNGAKGSKGATGPSSRTAGLGELLYGGTLSASAVRRLACDAGILPVVLGTNSRPLDVGTEKRFVTDAMRQALIVRDRGCVVCGAPPIMCDAHHIIHWAEGGATTLDNLVLLCKHDHRGTHHGYWDITITDGVVAVARPVWADPKPTRLRRPPPEPPPPPDCCPPSTPAPAGSAGWTIPAGSAGSSDQPNSPFTPEVGDGAGRTPPADSLLPSTTGEPRPPIPARAWPYTGDIPWITGEEAARLNPWGDDEPRQPQRERPRAGLDSDSTTWTSPWGDEPDTPTPDP